MCAPKGGLYWMGVRVYIPRPRGCLKCQRFGHGINTCVSCRQNVSTCVQCGQDEHGNNCSNLVKCKNCNSDHPPSSTDCCYYQLERETLTIQTRSKTSYWEAKNAATNKMVKPTVLYASVTAANTQTVRHPTIIQRSAATRPATTRRLH